MQGWNNQYAAALRHFLSQEGGRALIEQLGSGRPKISSDSIERAALSAHKVMGYDAALEAIERLANYSESSPASGPPFITT